jgi:hypothetical protein
VVSSPVEFAAKYAPFSIFAHGIGRRKVAGELGTKYRRVRFT